MRDLVCLTAHQQRFSKNSAEQINARKTKKEERTFHSMCCPLLVTVNTAFQTTLIKRHRNIITKSFLFLNSPIGLMSKKRTGVFRMLLNIRLCNVSVDLTRQLNMIRARMKPKMMVAPVKPDHEDKQRNTIWRYMKHVYICTLAGFDHEHTCIHAQIEIQVEGLSRVSAVG